MAQRLLNISHQLLYFLFRGLAATLFGLIVGHWLGHFGHHHLRMERIQVLRDETQNLSV